MNSGYTVVLVGNPNVGKSTIFNSFTGMHQHTGNWTGKTVESAKGEYRYNGKRYTVLDLPGTYSLDPRSAEESAACELLKQGEYDAAVIVLDAVCIERNLRFALSVLSQTSAPVVICVNLADEARKKGITIDFDKLSEMLCCRVISSSARSGKGLDELKSAIEQAAVDDSGKMNMRSLPTAEKIFRECCDVPKAADRFDRLIDKAVLSKSLGIPIMLLLLTVVFWLTMVGANYPSRLLSELFSKGGLLLRDLFTRLDVPPVITSALLDGVYTTLSWVVAVMLPPMAIFFPLFTLMEDCGLLPRIAFNMDTCFKCAGAHGKQSLTTAMGFGCNACAVTGCRIIDSPRERLIAMLTNSLIPCNGRFPLIITLITVFFCTGGGAGSSILRAVILTAFVVLSVVVSLGTSKLLSKTLMRGVSSSFVLELPPYRAPQLGKVIVRSVFDRTIFVLLRAVSVAAPAGLVIWLLANVNVSGAPLIGYLTDFLDPFAVILGFDGVVLAAFILGFPANEIVLPIALMIYMSQSTLNELPEAAALGSLLMAHGWTYATALCVIIFSMFHFPCSTACLTIYKETKSVKLTLLSIALPFAIGTIMCIMVHCFCMFFCAA